MNESKMPYLCKPKKKTSREMLAERLMESSPLAVHELNIIGRSQNALAIELSIMAKEGLVVGKYREKTRFKEWSPAPKAFA